MATIRLCNFHLHLIIIITITITIIIFSAAQSLNTAEGSRTPPAISAPNREIRVCNPRRVMIGSTAPTCTYNECRGCRHRCRAEQVPVEGNDPINSAYHYRCVCHR